MGLIGKGALRQVGVDNTDAATDGYVGMLLILTSVIERNTISASNFIFDFDPYSDLILNSPFPKVELLACKN